jgi:hypothetical protein
VPLQDCSQKKVHYWMGLEIEQEVGAEVGVELVHEIVFEVEAVIVAGFAFVFAIEIELFELAVPRILDHVILFVDHVLRYPVHFVLLQDHEDQCLDLAVFEAWGLEKN